MSLEQLVEKTTKVVEGGETKRRFVKTIYTMITVPVTIVRYVDKFGRILREATFLYRAPEEVLSPEAIGKYVVTTTPEDLAKIVETAFDMGMDYLSVLYSYVPPPPPWFDIEIPPPPKKKSLRLFWRKNFTNIVSQLMSVDARRKKDIERLNQLKPILVSELSKSLPPDKASSIAEKIYSDLYRRMMVASSPWELYSIEQYLYPESLLELARRYLSEEKK